MSFCGIDLYELYKVDKAIDNVVKSSILSQKEISRMANQVISQIEVLHNLGFVHGDLKLQNIYYNEETQSYHLNDFALVSKYLKSDN